jgi:hypothetical protein
MAYAAMRNYYLPGEWQPPKTVSLISFIYDEPLKMNSCL